MGLEMGVRPDPITQKHSDEAAFCVPVLLKRPPRTSVEGGVPVYNWSSSPFNDEQLI